MELDAVRAASKSAAARQKAVQERKRNLLVLILRHLVNAGYVSSFQYLCKETNLSLDRIDAADNVELLDILQDYEEGYRAKFGRGPKLVRNVASEPKQSMRPAKCGHAPTDAAPGSLAPLAASVLDRFQSMSVPGFRDRSALGGPLTGVGLARERRMRAADARTGLDDDGAEALPSSVVALSASGSAQQAAGTRNAKASAAKGQDVTSHVTSAGTGAAASTSDCDLTPSCLSYAKAHPRPASSDSEPDNFFDRQVARPIPPHLTGEYYSLAETVSSSILDRNPNVRWDAIVGLENAKHLLKEAVVHPIKYPDLFTGLLSPWKGVLLYGPPGTGKTMLAKAVATECKTTFFNISASSIISKWRGDSEKLIRTLFEMARFNAPSTIFIDEIDSLMMARGGEGEHEASRRMKTELLIQMDGLARSEELVFVLTATNLPWELDQAMLRRLEKRILVDVPCKEARRTLLTGLLTGRTVGTLDLDTIADAMEGYSGSDIMLVAKEAAMRPLRRLMALLEGTKGGLQGGVSCSSTSMAIGPVEHADMEAAIKAVKPSSHVYKQEYIDFTKAFASHVSSL